MYIKSISISAFGQLRDASFTLGRGLNVIEGKNETGKTTLGVFIKFIFYGLSATEREKYIPWGGVRCAGNINVVAGGHEYRIERELTVSGKNAKETVCIIDSVTGAQIHRDASPAEVFLGVNERVFSSTVYVGQINGAYVDGTRLTDAVENILFSADELTNTSRALKKLDEERVALLHKNKKGGLVFDLGEQIASLEVRLSRAQSANERLFDIEDRLASARLAKEKNARGAEEIAAKLEEYSAYSAIARKQRYEELCGRVDKAQEAYENIRAEYTHGDFLPNGAYIRSLYSLSEELSRLTSELEASEEKLRHVQAELSSVSDEADYMDRINELGGGDELLEKITESEFRRKKRARAGVLLLVSAAVLSAVGAAFFALPSLRAAVPYPAAIGCIAGAVIMCIAGAVMLSTLKKITLGIRELTSRFGCDGTEELYDLIMQIRDEELSIEKKRDAAKRAAGECERIRGLIGEKTASARTVTEQYRHTDDISPSTLAEEARRAEAVLEEINSAREEYEKLKASAEALGAAADKTDVAQQRARIHGVLKATEIEDFDEAEQKRRLDFLRHACDNLTEKIISLEREYSAASASAESPSSIADTLLVLRKQRAEAEERLRACVLAYEMLSEAAKTLREGISPKLARDCGGLMEKLTDGKYSLFGINDRYEISYTSEGITHGADSLSGGTQDIAYVSLRLALLDVLFRADPPPVIFDDTFAHVDTDRMERLIAHLASLGDGDSLQSVVFTCHKRESEAARKHESARIIKL